MKKYLERQAGVEKVLVSLRDGTVEITPKDNGEINPKELLSATYKSGVSVVEMDAIVSGRVKRTPEGLTLQYEPSRSFAISPNQFASQLEPLAGSNTDVTVKGRLFEKNPGKKKPKKSEIPKELNEIPNTLKLFILDIQKKG